MNDKLEADNGSPILVSVVVPCFNEEFNIPELCERVLRVLDHGGLTGELVLVDDGSADGTRRVIEQRQAQDPDRVHGCFHARNQGITAAWKTGVAASRGL